MANREKRLITSRLLWSAAITAVSLLVLLAIIAWLIWKRIISERQLMYVSLPACMIAGAAGEMSVPRGEGKGWQRLVIAAVPSLLLLLLGTVCFFREGLGPFLPASTLCLFLPGMISALTGWKNRRKHSVLKRKRRTASFRG